MYFLRALFDTIIPAAQAHEKWFVHAPGAYAQPEFYRTLNPWTVGFGIVAVTAVIAGIVIDRWYERTALYEKFEEKIRPLRDHAAGVLAVTTGIMLVFNAWRGTLLATNFPFTHDAVGLLLRGIEATVGALLLIGLFTPIAAAGLVLLFIAIFIFYPLAPQIELINLLGIGVFLFFFARGRYSLDWFLGKPIFSTASERKVAYFFLRVTLGIAILILSFWNKWLDPGYHLSLMDRYPSFNPYMLLTWTGLFHFTREQYIFLLFFVETTIGFYEMLGLFTRVAALLLMPVFCASVIFLPLPELVGHLPILGTLFVMFVYGDTYHKGRAPHKNTMA